MRGYESEENSEFDLSTWLFGAPLACRYIGEKSALSMAKMPKLLKRLGDEIGASCDQGEQGTGMQETLCHRSSTLKGFVEMDCKVKLREGHLVRNPHESPALSSARPLCIESYHLEE